MTEHEVDEKAVKQAVKARREYILENLETITLKALRKQLEEDMGLPADALRSYKDLISKLIDKVIASASKVEAKEDAPAKSKGRSKKSEGKERAEGKAAKEKGGKVAKEEGGKGKRKAEEPAAKPAGPRQYGKRVVKLREMCKEATIPVGPAIYRNKSEEQVAEALEALLEKHGLSAKSGRDEIARVKRNLAKQRDLDGIDTSNIIEDGGRGRRRQAAAAPVNYRQMLVDSEEESGEEDEEESGSEGGAESEAESGGEEGSAWKASGKAAAPKQKAQRKAGGSRGREEKEDASLAGASSGSEEEDEGYQTASGSDAEENGEEEQQQGAGPSPDENRATGNEQDTGAATAAKCPAQPSPAKVPPKTTAAEALEDSDAEGKEVPAKKQRTVVCDWSDDE